MHLKGIFIILEFLGLGHLCSWLINGFLPGSVVGMLLLFGALLARIVKADSVRPVANFLTRNMTLFFLPASIGIMEQWGIIRANFAAWVVILIVPTVCVLLSVCGAQDGMMKLSERIRRKEAKHGA